jgi:tetratricopeptide (TPR) repeat protein
LIGGALVALAILAAYSNSLSGPFVFDDLPSIRDNPTIRHLRAIGSVLSPPGSGAAVQNRPVVNLSLAINYALGGEQVLGYHLFNLGVHIVAALMLLGVVRRTLLLPAFADRFGASATWHATVVALLWGLHPLATEAVTYTIQRTESMFSMFYLLTLYCCIRGYGVAGAKGWFAAAIGSCFLGMGCKEAMATAPLMVLLYDWVFVTRSWKEMFQRRWGLYVGLAATWILLGIIMVRSSGSRGTAAGFGLGMTWWEYARTQFWAICRYLRLAFWPSGLVVDYGTWIARAPGDIVPCAIIVTLLVIATLAAYVRWPWAGYLGTWFFVILAPSSSVVPLVTQTVAEKRMYLPLAAVAAFVVFVVGAAGKRLLDRTALPEPVRRRRTVALAVAVVGCVAVVLGFLSVLRNRDYRSELALWDDTIRKRPDNPRAYGSRADTYGRLGDWDNAIADCDKIIELRPNNAEAYLSRGNTYNDKGDSARAIADYSKAIELKPDYVEAYVNRGNAYKDKGDSARAIADYSKAIELKPDYGEAYVNRGVMYSETGAWDRAVQDLTKAIALKPNIAAAYSNRADALNALGQYPQAVRDCDKALALDPDLAEAYYHRSNAYSGLGDSDRAIADSSKLIELRPNNAEAYLTRGNAYGAKGDNNRAIADYSKAIELKPDFADAYINRGVTYSETSAYDRAVQDFTKAIALKPDFVAAYSNRASAYCGLRDYERAWADVKALETLGAKPPPQLLKLLTQVRAAQPKP